MQNQKLLPQQSIVTLVNVTHAISVKFEFEVSDIGKSQVSILYVHIGGSKGGLQGRPPLPGPNSFIFMQFSAKNLQNNRLAHPLIKIKYFFLTSLVETTISNEIQSLL